MSVLVNIDMTNCQVPKSVIPRCITHNDCEIRLKLLCFTPFHERKRKTD